MYFHVHLKTFVVCFVSGLTGKFGRLGHGMERNQMVPRMVEVSKRKREEDTDRRQAHVTYSSIQDNGRLSI